MTDADLIWWEQMRGRGRVWYVFREGILRHGVRVGLWLTLLGVLGWLSGGSVPSMAGVAVWWASTTTSIGALIGVALWNQHEQNYRKAVGSRK